jgi:DNA polymerase-3 subunit alpha
MSKIDELVAKAKELGMTSLAITDHGNMYGAIEFYKACKAAGIKPILGVEAYIAPGDHKDKTAGGVNEDRYYHLILLAKNKTGWENLLKLVTQSYLEGYYYKPRMDKQMLREHHEGLIALSGCLGGELSQALFNGKAEQAEKIALEHEEIFGKGNYYIEVQSHDKIKDVAAVLPKQIALAQKLGIPMVATQDSHYLNSDDCVPHDILLAIQTGKKVSDKNRLCLEDDFSFSSEADMRKRLKACPEAVDNTGIIADQCNLELELGKILLPKFDTPDGSDSKLYLRKLVAERTPARYPNIDEITTKRIEYELGVIEKTGFADYFLIVQDFINWAKERGVVVGPGRGSAAGSIISYILRITDLDPIKYELLFERFLNPERIQMPDIDVDITDVRRDEVFAYLEDKYGKDRVAHIITFGTMAARASIRDVGRALDIEYGFCDMLAKLVPTNNDLDEALSEVQELKDLYKKDERAKRIIDAAKRLEGVARHASVHACGTVIAAEPLTKRVPLQHAPQDENITVTQFEMHAIEDLGLLKMDILGLKNLTIIENTVRLIQELTGKLIDISTIPLDDEKAFELFKTAQTTGVFQLESGGMRRYLKELKPTELEDIIAMVALYRPGPMELIPSYINRKYGREQVTYLHPSLEPILKKTYGIGVYQEQMMRIASDLAGFSLAQADTLRKAIGKKIKKLLDEQQEKLITGMVKNGIPQRTAEAIWELFPPFARYGFNRSHAACYAMIAYQTAYLKANYPVEFMTSLFNSESDDIDRISFLINECKKMDIQVLPPDINKSSARFTPDGHNIRFGLDAVKNVGSAIVGAIIEERGKGGEFKTFSELLTRVKHKDLNKKSLEALTKCGALDGLGTERNQILNNMEEVIKFASAAKKADPAGGSGQAGLFGATFATSNVKPLKLAQSTPATKTQRLAWEKELLGLYVSDHPLNTKTEEIKAIKATLIKAMRAERSTMKTYRIAGMITAVKSIIAKNGKPMAFARIEDSSDGIEVVIFSELFTKFKDLWQDGKIVAVVGKLSPRNGELNMIIDNAKEL